eukprot:gene24558-30918_t
MIRTTVGLSHLSFEQTNLLLYICQGIYLSNKSLFQGDICRNQHGPVVLSEAQWLAAAVPGEGVTGGEQHVKMDWLSTIVCKLDSFGWNEALARVREELHCSGCKEEVVSTAELQELFTLRSIDESGESQSSVSGGAGKQGERKLSGLERGHSKAERSSLAAALAEMVVERVNEPVPREKLTVLEIAAYLKHLKGHVSYEEANATVCFLQGVYASAFYRTLVSDEICMDRDTFPVALREDQWTQVEPVDCLAGCDQEHTEEMAVELVSTFVASLSASGTLEKTCSAVTKSLCGYKEQLLECVSRDEWCVAFSTKLFEVLCAKLVDNYNELRMGRVDPSIVEYGEEDGKGDECVPLDEEEERRMYEEFERERERVNAEHDAWVASLELEGD